MSWLRRRHGYCTEPINQKFNPRCRPGPQARFLTSPIAASSEVFASAYLSLLLAEGLSALIPFIKRILITIFLMGQGSCCLVETPRYRHNSWWCWSGLPQNSWRFVGGTVSCLSACASKLGRAWFFISCSTWMGRAWPRCRGNGSPWGICRNAIKPASPRSAPGSVGGLCQVITASGQTGPDVGKVRLRFLEAFSGNTDQLRWPVDTLSTTLNPLEDSGRLPRQRCRGLIGLEYPGRGGPRLKDARAIFHPRFHFPRHAIPQPMLRRSTSKSFQINALNLVGKIGQPSSFGENPPIRREKARPFRPRTIKVSGEKPAKPRKFTSLRRAETKFA
jgi:hypothetical protein